MASDAIVRLLLNTTDFDSKLVKSRKGVKDLGFAGTEAGKLLSALGGTVTKLAGVLGIATSATKVLTDALLSTEDNVDEWGRTMESAKSIYSQFCFSLNNTDISGFITRMGDIVRNARAAYDAIDELNTKGGILSNAEAQLNADRARYQAIIKDPKSTQAQKDQATAALNALKGQRAAAAEQTKTLNNNAIKAMLREQLVGGDKLTEAEYQKYYKTIVASLYKPEMADKLNNISIKRSKFNVGNNSQNGVYYGGGGYQDTSFKLGSIMTDEFRDKLKPYIQAYWNAEARRWQDDRSDNRIIGGGKGGNGSTTQKIVDTFVAGANSLEQLTTNVSVLKKELDGIAVGTEEWRIKTQELVTAERDLNNARQMQKDLSEFYSGKFTYRTKGADMGISGYLKDNSFNADAILADKKNGKLNLSTSVTGEVKDGNDGMQRTLTQINKGLSGVNAIASGIKGMGIALPDEIEKSIGVIQGVVSVIEGVGTIVELFSTTAESANTLALTVNTSSIAALTAAVWANTAASAIPFAGGGYLHAAGGVVAGRNYIDRVPATLTSGEMVINEADQRRLYDTIKGGGSGSGNASSNPWVDGERLYLALDNFGRRSGRGRVVFARG